MQFHQTSSSFDAVSNSNGLSEAECSDIFDMLLEVIMTDNKVADGEARTVAVAGEILGLSPDAIHARIRAMGC